MRRTLTLAGAAVLAVGLSGLAGPAAADSGAGIAQQGTVHINEVGADMDTGGLVDIEGDFIELRELTDKDPFALEGHKLVGCNGTNFFDIVEFGISDVIPAGGVFLVADDTYDASPGPARDKPFATTGSPSPNLVQAAGGVALVPISTSPALDTVMWGSSVPQACSGYASAGVLPTNAQSINRTGPSSWVQSSPTPGIS